MVINRKILDVGFLLGWYAGFFNYAMVREQTDTMKWARKNMCSIIDAVTDTKVSCDVNDVANLVRNVLNLYSQYALNKDANAIDYWSIGEAFFMIYLSKKTPNAGLDKKLVSSLEKAGRSHIGNISSKTILFKSKFYDFLEYVVDKIDIDNFDSDAQIVESVLNVIYDYLTKPIGRKKDAFVLVDDVAGQLKDRDALQDESDYYSELNNEIKKIGKLDDSVKNDNTNLNLHDSITKASPYVFISYSSKNEVAANVMRDTLTKENISNWMAPYDIPAGMDYPSVISEAIENCSCVLLLLSNQSQSSRYVYSEIRIAYDADKPIISMNLDDCQLIAGFKLLLGTHQIVPAKTDDDIEKIISSIKYNLNKTK